MSYNEALRQKLKINIYVVIFFLVISTIFLGLRLYYVFFTDLPLIEINGRLLTMDYLYIMIFIYGVLALITSILIRKNFDNFYPKEQVRLFAKFGMLFMPYTIILFILGVMKYLEKEQFKKELTRSMIYGLVLLSLIFSVSVSQLNKIRPLYKNVYTYQFEYRFDTFNFMPITLTATSRGEQLEQIFITGETTMADPSTLDPNLDILIYKLKVNDKSLCFEVYQDDAMNAYPTQCTMDAPFDVGLTTEDFSDKDNIELYVLYIDKQGAYGNQRVNIHFTDEEYDENIYD